MTAARCQGKVERDGEWRYVYGPCRNLDYEEHERDGRIIRVPSCAIHKNRPRVCSGYPEYDFTEKQGGSHYGCGYGKGEQVQTSAEEQASLMVPLSDDEK